jgi:hypothetical protein
MEEAKPEPSRVEHTWVASKPYPQRLALDKKYFRERNATSYYFESIDYAAKKFYNIDTWISFYKEIFD